MSFEPDTPNLWMAQKIKESGATIPVLTIGGYQDLDEMESALAEGKRIRPFLVMEFCRLFGGDARAALPFACAIECVHASSLIHDDMPCMDNDDLRRGKPTNHVVFGEDIALLAGDALITRGYEIAAENTEVAPEIALAATAMLLKNAGAYGMMGGQQIDLWGEKNHVDFPLLLKMHWK